MSDDMITNTATVERSWFMPTPPDTAGLVPTLAALAVELFREDLAEWNRHRARSVRGLARMLKG